MSLKLLLVFAAVFASGCSSYIPRQTHVRYPDQTPDHNAPVSRYPAPAVINPPVISGSVHTSINEPSRDVDTARPDVYTSPSDSGSNRPRTANASLQPKPLNNALGSLISQAQNQFSDGDYQAAIATAERGLRIDRRTPELYLVLAKSYLQLGQGEQAAQFANQGLRYSTSGSREAGALEDTRRKALNN